MIYDCFAFFNELDLLEIRLNTLNEVVDKFVLVEATRTFQKKEKPLLYNENKERFKDFNHKIIHIVVDRFPTFWRRFRVPHAWDYDNHQKSFIKEGIKEAKDDDIILISDLDEIPDPEKLKENAGKAGIKVFKQKFFYYFINSVNIDPLTHQEQWWNGTIMLKKSEFTSVKKVWKYRDNKFGNTVYIENGGWHFSYLGGVEKIIKKIESLAHPEFNTPYFKDPQRINEIIKSGKDLFDRNMMFKTVEVDNTYPGYILENKERFSHLINS